MMQQHQAGSQPCVISQALSRKPLCPELTKEGSFHRWMKSIRIHLGAAYSTLLLLALDVMSRDVICRKRQQCPRWTLLA